MKRTANEYLNRIINFGVKGMDYFKNGWNEITDGWTILISGWMWINGG